MEQRVPVSKRGGGFADGGDIGVSLQFDDRGGEVPALAGAPHERFEAEQEGVAGSGIRQGGCQRFDSIRAAIFTAVWKFSRERSAGSRATWK